MSAAPEQPPRAGDVPEAVREALHAAWYWVHHEHDANDCAERLRYITAAIATALREARDQGAADTARLAELVAAADDILPDDWDTRRCPKFTRLWLAIGEMQNAARAAEPERSDAT